MPSHCRPGSSATGAGVSAASQASGRSVWWGGRFPRWNPPPYRSQCHVRPACTRRGNRPSRGWNRRDRLPQQYRTPPPRRGRIPGTSPGRSGSIVIIDDTEKADRHEFVGDSPGTWGGGCCWGVMSVTANHHPSPPVIYPHCQGVPSKSTSRRGRSIPSIRGIFARDNGHVCAVSHDRVHLPAPLILSLKPVFI